MSKAETVAALIVNQIRRFLPFQGEGITGKSCKANAAKEIAKLLAPHLAGEWLPIESAPKGCVSVLLGSTECAIVTTGYADFMENLCTDGHDPNRWQPLPAPPKGEQSA